MTKADLPSLKGLIVDSAELAREYRKRASAYEFKSIDPRNSQELIEAGWEVDRRLNKRVRYKKLKSFDERLENDFWCLLYKMAYPAMNAGRTFRVAIPRDDAEDASRQIDVFAKDDETVIVAECKTATEQKKKSLQKELDAFANSKKSVANAIRAYFGTGFKPKILWLFVTRNIIWSDADIETAKTNRIKVITERELKYLDELVSHVGYAAKYQFLAEYLEGQEIPELSDRKVPAIRGKLGGKTFYSFVATPKQLLKIAFVNHRALNDPAGIPTYQRLLQKTRLKKIGEYITGGGYFPTNLLLNFKKRLRFDISAKDDEAGIHFGHLYLPDTYKSAWIIDGQHRLFGYSMLDEKFLKQNIVVLAFDGMPRADEANLFVTINHEQKSVPRNLLDDLEGELRFGSTKPVERIGAICALVVRNLNGDRSSPLYNRVTEPGIRATEITCLTIPEIKDGLRHSGLVGAAVLKKKVFKPGPLTGETDDETLSRASQVLIEYFELIRGANPIRWNQGRSGLLCMNPAVRGFTTLLAELIAFMEGVTHQAAQQLSPKELVAQILPYLEPVLKYVKNADDQSIQRELKVPFGGTGPRQYYYRLCRIVAEEFPAFAPQGYKAWSATQSGAQVDQADKRVKEISAQVQKTTIRVLKSVYGTAVDEYWERGIPSKEIKVRAYEKKLDDGENDHPIDTYLDIVDIKKIVEHKNNWEHFKPYFDIPMAGAKGLAKNLEWMERFNKVRRIPAHSTERRNYTMDDFSFLEWLEANLNQRIS